MPMTGREWMGGKGWRLLSSPPQDAHPSKEKVCPDCSQRPSVAPCQGIKLTHLHGVHTKTHKQRTQGFGTRRRIEWGVGGVYKRQQSKWLERVTNELQPNFEWTYTDFFLSASS